jgi:CHRD domain
MIKSRCYNICYCRASISHYNSRNSYRFSKFNICCRRRTIITRKIVAELTSVEELPPPNNTSAIGIAEFNVGEDNMLYRVNVTDVENVTAAHIRSSQVRENDPLWLHHSKKSNNCQCCNNWSVVVRSKHNFLSI